MIGQSIFTNSDSDEKGLQKYENLLEIQRIKQREAEKTEQIEELLQKNQKPIKKKRKKALLAKPIRTLLRL